ncbi:MAG TPA: peptidase M48, partial [Myxococcota bacterium]|nr:peptidase M48 [Myxococcota bacterium]
HAASPHFAETLKTLRTPHPYDSHPLLEERLRSVNARVRLDQAAELMGAARSGSWADDIGTADAIEQRLWADYETRFRAHHDTSLAYRYRPANAAEKALVERFFPDCSFKEKDYELRLTHEGLVVPSFEPPLLRFEQIVKAEVNQTSFRHELKLECGVPGATKRTKVNLRKLGKQADGLKAAFNLYWARDQAARQYEQLRRDAADING